MATPFSKDMPHDITSKPDISNVSLISVVINGHSFPCGMRFEELAVTYVTNLG